jgi:hypothetical protein
MWTSSWTAPRDLGPRRTESRPACADRLGEADQGFTAVVMPLRI